MSRCRSRRVFRCRSNPCRSRGRRRSSRFLPLPTRENISAVHDVMRAATRRVGTSCADTRKVQQCVLASTRGGYRSRIAKRNDASLKPWQTVHETQRNPTEKQTRAKKKHCRNLGYDSSVVQFPHFNHYVEGSIHKHCGVCTGTARPDGSRRWDNRMAAQHLPRELVQPSSVYEEMAQNIRDRKAWALPPCLF